MRGVQGLADGAAQIGLQRVPVAPVVVLVGGECGLHRVGAAAEEVVREPPLLQHAGRQPDEVLGSGERRAGRADSLG